ncbi:unnamed protein product [Linum tenue]|uniref:Uncharacterized protein n=1 Tax=Linum tenue TaxID=586396 RepID=A0AAV0IQZ0_9ROSI|nr:unnamed protein product [Linum tenue]
MASEQQRDRYFRYGQVKERIAYIELQLQHLNLQRLEQIEAELAQTAENQLDQKRLLATRGSDLMKTRRILQDEIHRLNAEADRLAERLRQEAYHRFH